MSDIQILEQPAEDMIHLDQTFDLIYMDPPFGLQRDFKMQEEDGTEKSFSDHWTSFDDFMILSNNLRGFCVGYLRLFFSLLLIKYTSPPNGWVFDPFCGSGTTAISAFNTNRNCITTDTNPDAVKIARESIDELAQAVRKPHQEPV